MRAREPSAVSLEEGLQDYVNKDARYRRDNPGSPISYTVTFLTDNEFARMGFTTDYTETECVRYPNAFVKVAHAGGYVAKFKVTWVEPDSYGTYNQPKEWESGDTTVGFTHQVDMPRRSASRPSGVNIAAIRTALRRCRRSS
jgi:thiol-activated cytolysin